MLVNINGLPVQKRVVLQLRYPEEFKYHIPWLWLLGFGMVSVQYCSMLTWEMD